jgi:hypothetical protein
MTSMISEPEVLNQDTRGRVRKRSTVCVVGWHQILNFCGLDAQASQEGVGERLFRVADRLFGVAP